MAPLQQQVRVPGADGESPESLRFRVTKMTCAGCAASIQRSLESRGDVTSASVSFITGTATVQGAHLNSASVIDAIKGLGFAAELIRPEEVGDVGSEIEKQTTANERIWRSRAIVGMSLWLPLETLHWTASALHWHGPWMSWLMFFGSMIILVFAGSEFYKSAWKAAIRRKTNMDTLISMGATTAFVYSSIVFFLQLDQPTYFAEAAGLLGIVSLGHWFEARASSRAGSAVRELLQLQPETAEVLRDDGTSESVPSTDVKKDWKIAIRPGGRVPVDGVVIEGGSAVDESIVTGESIPIEKSPGDSVVAGSMNTTGRLIVLTSVDGRHTTISRIADLVQKAQTSRAPIQRLADQISGIFVPSVILIAIVTLFGWWLAGDFAKGVIATVTVLIISCPCALGLATPMAVMVGTGEASRRGILIKNAATLERIGRAKHVIFDKTGTLTTGRPEVAEIAPVHGVTEKELLTLAAAVEFPSEHLIAKAIVRAASEHGLELPSVTDFLAIPGQGVQGRIDGRFVVVDRDKVATARVVVDGQNIGTLTLTDRLRSDAVAAVSALRIAGVNVTMLSGDRKEVAEKTARSLGLQPEDVFSEATPESKAERVRSFGENAIMVGDGLNDAAALAASGLGVALASGTNVAIEAASVVIPGDRVAAIPELLQLSRATLKTIRQNLFFAFLYNALVIPLAAFGMLGSSGPLWAALAMGASDVTVVGNALRLKWALQKQRRNA